MNEIVWNDNLLIGDEIVDSQHKELVKLVNNLVCSCKDENADVLGALAFLRAYTAIHFKDEEVLQKRYGFPEYKVHKKLHTDFKVTVNELVTQYINSNGSTDMLQVALKEILVTWLINHIMNEDKKIGFHIEHQKNEKE